jgi:short-subunit dehydrogenase
MRNAYVQAALLLALFLWVRDLSGFAFVLLVAAPVVAYGLLSNRTRPHPLRGATVLITGASSGLGRALAIDAARRGARRVHLVARTERTLRETEKQMAVAAPGTETHIHLCDVGDSDAVASMAAQIVTQHGAPEILVNNAGAGAWKHIEDTPPGEARQMLAVPTMAAAYLTQAFVPAMAQRGYGHVVNVTSAASMAGFRGAVVYGTARWGVRGLSRYLYADLAPLGIGVTLFNGAEITGTEYFSDAPGKAGSASHDAIPWLFQLPFVRAVTPDTNLGARYCWDAVERGEFEALVPWYLLAPMDLVARLFPDVLHALLKLGDNGRR